MSLSLFDLKNKAAIVTGSTRGLGEGVDQMTKVMALEWAKQGIRVNAIGPTYFETELEGIVIFLAAPASDCITGQTIYIDGGWTAC